jgi:branched-chain amino acid transport system permease protein
MSSGGTTKPALTGSASQRGRHAAEQGIVPGSIALLVCLVVLAGAGSGFMLLVGTQVLVLWCFGLSYQVLFGRTGMLSFGHAVNFGLSALMTAHVVRALSAGADLPVYELLPLVGALTGLGCGIVLGFPISRRSGIAFAMVTLGLGELVAACFLMFPGFFGGEAGVTLRRTAVSSIFGIDYGQPRAQFVFTAVWALAVLGFVGWIGRTPFGMAAQAVRENPERIQYLGLRTASIRWVSCIVAATLAGIAGALSALAYEIVTVDSVSLHASANVLLVTVIGGLQSLFGPLVGAVFLTVMQSVVSEFTRAWLFYYGMVFVVLVLVAPDGVLGLLRRDAIGRFTWRSLVGGVGFAVAVVVFVESAYQLSLGEPTRLPGWNTLQGPALAAVTVVAGLAVAAGIARWRRAGARP